MTATNGVTAGTVLVLSRGLAPAFLVLIVAGSLLLLPREEWRRTARVARMPIAVVGAATVAALAWTASVGSVWTGGVAHPEYESLRRYVHDMLVSLNGFERQMIGVFSRHWIEPMAHVLKNLGSERVWVAHGSDGLDEITTSGPTSIAALENGQVRVFELAPEDVGLKKAPPEALRGGDAETNATALMAVLQGTRGPFRDVALLNAAAAGCGLLVIAGVSPPARVRLTLDARSRRLVGAYAAAAVVVFALFFETVHVGHDIRDPEIGSFRSRFTAAELADAANARGQRWRTKPPG